MILDLKTDIFKTLTQGGGQPPAPAAPAAAPAGGAQPAPTDSQPRRGHKYVKRWWDGTGWQYEYPGEGTVQQAHHPAEHTANDPSHSHVLELPEGDHQNPEQSYHQTLSSHFQPGASHEIAHPSDPSKRMKLDVDAKGQMIGTDAATGAPVNGVSSRGKALPFSNYGSYEAWYKGAQQKPTTVHTAEGKPWATLAPIVGKGSPAAGGMFMPATGDKNYKLVMPDDADPQHYGSVFPKKVNSNGKPRKELDSGHKSRESALSALHQYAQRAQHETGTQFPFLQGGAAAAGLQGAAGAAAPGTSAVRTGPKQIPAWMNDSKDPIVQRMAQAGWDWVPGRGERGAKGMVDQLKVSPQEKHAMIGQLAMRFSTPQSAAGQIEGGSPLIHKIANSMARKTPDLADKFNEMLGIERGEQSVAMPQEGSFLYNALGQMLNNYDPNKVNPKTGTPMSLMGYVAGSLPGYMQRHVKLMRDEQSAIGGSQYVGGDKHGIGATDRTAGMVSNAPQLDDTGVDDDYDPSMDVTSGDEDEAPDLRTWQSRQTANIGALRDSGQLNEQQHDYLTNKIQGAKFPHEAHAFAEGMHNAGLGQHAVYMKDFERALKVALAMLMMKAHADNALIKASSTGQKIFLQYDKKVDPSHTYAHREGDEDHPRFFFRDPQNNFVRYTNAPSGHADNSKFQGDAAIHPSEPTFQTAPQYFDPQGRKLTRAPEAGAPVQWNPSYHPNDPENLWVGRWVDPVTGEHVHTYVDADMRMIPKMYLHQQIQLVDSRLPVLRKYIRTLFSSPMLKDKIVATCLALIDQARFRAEEIGHLLVGDVKMYGSVYDIGGRLVYGDHKFRTMMTLLTKNRRPQEPLFAVPMVKKDGKADPMLLRNIGPHYIQAILEQLGLSLTGLIVYHASETFSREVERLLREHDTPWESACEYATAAVAQEMGHNLAEEQNIVPITRMLREVLIDPVVVEVLERNADDAGLTGDQQLTLPLPPPPVMLVTFDLLARNSDEQSFSKWLHVYPAHLHAEPMQPTMMQAPNMPNSPSPVAQMNPLTQETPQQDSLNQQLGAIA
jgi:hypothetical protein